MPCSKILSWRHKRCILRPFIRPLYPTYFWNFKKCLNYQNCFGCWTFLKSISQKMVHTSKISISPIHQNFHISEMVHNSILHFWLDSLGLGHHLSTFTDHGYDHLEICKQVLVMFLLQRTEMSCNRQNRKYLLAGSGR